MSWYLKVLRDYAIFQGRARRKEYWYFFLFNLIVAFGIGIIFGALKTLFGIPSSYAQLYTLGILIPSIAVAVRRIHDTGHSGWWILCPIYNIVLLVRNGQSGTNYYGSDPKFGI